MRRDTHSGVLRSCHVSECSTQAYRYECALGQESTELHIGPRPLCLKLFGVVCWPEGRVWFLLPVTKQTNKRWQPPDGEGTSSAQELGGSTKNRQISGELVWGFRVWSLEMVNGFKVRSG